MRHGELWVLGVGHIRRMGCCLGALSFWPVIGGRQDIKTSGLPFIPVHYALPLASFLCLCPSTALALPGPGKSRAAGLRDRKDSRDGHRYIVLHLFLVPR